MQMSRDLADSTLTVADLPVSRKVQVCTHVIVGNITVENIPSPDLAIRKEKNTFKHS
jgi:hypothetical protein